MSIKFDITPEELPIFLAEAEEHLQVLDEGLVKLEKSETDADLLQSMFRAAHTLKGSAGMIGHKRMVDLTHALETVFDGLRKHTLTITPELVDVLLEGVDTLRVLCGEVVDGIETVDDIQPLVEQFSEAAEAATANRNTAAVSATAEPAKSKRPKSTSSRPGVIPVQAVISSDSIASAARAFQLLMTLQELGEIVHMQPSQQEIESAAPVKEFYAEVISGRPAADIRRALATISEIERLAVGADEIQQANNDASPEAIPPLGEFLVRNNLVTPAQLQQAVRAWQQEKGPASILGQTLVKMGFLSQEVLDEVVAEQNRQKQAVQNKGDSSKDTAHARGGDKTVRTSVERLDALMNLVGELITDRNRMYQLRSEMDMRFHGDPQIETLADTIGHIGRITDQLQGEVMSIRMLPISSVFNKFPRLVRDLSRKADKQVELVIRGEDTELDRSVIEVISDPLIHLIRNSVDHGIESPEDRRKANKPERGVILLTARHEQGHIVVTVEDDGRGIDINRVKAKAVEKELLSAAEANALSEEESINLIFLSGLSTAKTVTDVSGRGVGMDIVRSNIERLNGSVTVETWSGVGSKFQITLPLTLAIVPTLLVRVRHGTYAIPLVTVTETLRVDPQEIQTVNLRPVIRLRDQVLPLVRLSEVFHISRQGQEQDYEFIVVVGSGKSMLGLIVDRLVGQQEVVVKSLSSIVGEVPGISSAAILGDGQVALIVDVQGLFKLVSAQANARHERREG